MSTKASECSGLRHARAERPAASGVPEKTGMPWTEHRVTESPLPGHGAAEGGHEPSDIDDGEQTRRSRRCCTQRPAASARCRPKRRRAEVAPASATRTPAHGRRAHKATLTSDRPSSDGGQRASWPVLGRYVACAPPPLRPRPRFETYPRTRFIHVLTSDRPSSDGGQRASWPVLGRYVACAPPPLRPRPRFENLSPGPVGRVRRRHPPFT